MHTCAFIGLKESNYVFTAETKAISATLLGTSATLLGTGALLVVTRNCKINSAWRCTVSVGPSVEAARRKRINGSVEHETEEGDTTGHFYVRVM